MAGGTILQVKGLKELQAALKDAEDGSLRDMRKAMRSALLPIVADAKGRFEGLGGTGPRTAGTVRSFNTSNGIGVQFGGNKGYEFGREFGARYHRISTFTQRRPSGPVQVTRRMDYSKPSIFGPWTGNRFLLKSGRVSGRAFNPAVQDHWRVASKAINKVLDDYSKKILAPGE